MSRGRVIHNQESTPLKCAFWVDINELRYNVSVDKNRYSSEIFKMFIGERHELQGVKIKSVMLLRDGGGIVIITKNGGVLDSPWGEIPTWQGKQV